jgi:hypothetical protein
MRVALVSLLMLFFVAGHAFAATVNATSGQVFLSSGEGYRKVVGSTQAGPGARVVVNPGGSGQIYSDGCVIEVAPGVVAVVAKQSPCGGGGSAKSAGGGGGGGGSAGGDAGLFAVGAAVVGAGVGAAALMGKDKSASP